MISPISIHASEKTTIDLKEILEIEDWKTDIPLNIRPIFLNWLFEHNSEIKTYYTTSNLNMRTFPNINAEIEKVLPVNTKVNVVSECNGWSKIIVENNSEEKEEFYLWNEFLSKEKVKIKKTTSTNSYNSSSSATDGSYLGNFKLTAYCNCSSCCGKWAGGATASGSMPVAGRTVAMGGISFGTKLSINGHVYTVEDRGTPYGHVDIYFDSHSEALNFGLRYADVYMVD